MRHINHDDDFEIDERTGDFKVFSELYGYDREESSDYDEDDELEDAGLDRFELEGMDEDERREALEDAGLDPDDYDF